MNKFSDYNIKTMLDLFHIVPNCYGVPCANIAGEDIMRAGVIFVNENNEVMQSVPFMAATLATEKFGVSNSIWSKSFHNNWDKVATANYYTLVFEQLVHYFSTYGMEMLGYDALPIIPAEQILSDPNQRPDFKAFTIVRMVNIDAAMQLIVDYLHKTIAPHKDKVNEIIELMAITDIKPEEIVSLELRTARYHQLDMVPIQGDDFLRYVVYDLTDETLIIKNKSLIQKLKKACIDYPDKVYQYFSQARLSELAKYFYRFKPLWLAFKTAKNCAPYINKMRRLANVYHQPMSDVNVQNLSKLLKENRMSDVDRVICTCSIRQLIKLYNHFAAMTTTTDNCVAYHIRNGKMWVNRIDDAHKKMDTHTILKIVNLLQHEIRARIVGTKRNQIYLLPSYMEYAMPVSEKQFIGNIPYGSQIDLNICRNVFAIHWENFKGHRTDLDLHFGSITHQYGWNSSYRSDDRQILYSGDMTDATYGAVEAFSFYPDGDKYILSVNNFTCANDVPFEFFMTQNWDSNAGRGAAVDVKDALFTPIPLKFNEDNTQTIGLVDGYTFSFYGGELGYDIVPKREYYEDVIHGLAKRMNYMLTVEDYLFMADATVVNEMTVHDLTEEEKERVIDLSPSVLTARSLLDLIDED